MTDYKLFSPHVSLSGDGRWLFAVMRKTTGQAGKWLERQFDTGCPAWRVLASWDGDRMYSLCEGQVAIIPREGGQPALVKLPGGWGIGMNDMALSPDGKRLYLGVGDPLASGHLKEVWVLTTKDLSVTARFQAPAEFGHLALGGGSLYPLSKGTSPRTGCPDRRPAPGSHRQARDPGDVSARAGRALAQVHRRATVQSSHSSLLLNDEHGGDDGAANGRQGGRRSVDGRPAHRGGAHDLAAPAGLAAAAQRKRAVQ